MKKNTNTSFFYGLLSLFILISACQSSPVETENLEALIQKVEQGLSGQVYIEGDPT